MFSAFFILRTLAAATTLATVLLDVARIFAHIVLRSLDGLTVRS